jgi:cytochrome c
MKKILLVSALLFAACSTKPAQEQSETTPTPAADAVVIESKGQSLIQANDCQTCHHTKNVLVGPSYTAIASRYDVNNENKRLLVSKIINGGTGVWGDTPMNAHPTLPEADALEMVNYILSLK